MSDKARIDDLEVQLRKAKQSSGSHEREIRSLRKQVDWLRSVVLALAQDQDVAELLGDDPSIPKPNPVGEDGKPVRKRRKVAMPPKSRD